MPISTSSPQAEAQVKVREATSNDPWGPSTALMSEIADLTHNPMAFTEIMSIVWKRLNDSGKNWRHIRKSLVLLDFLIKCEHEKVAQQCRVNVFTIETLKDFQHVEDSRDQGLNICEKPKQTTSLLSDDERLKNERTRFILTRSKLKQNNPGPIGAEGGRSNRHYISDSALGKKHLGPIPSTKRLDHRPPLKKRFNSRSPLHSNNISTTWEWLTHGVYHNPPPAASAPAATLTSSNSFDFLGGDLLSPTNSMTASTTNFTNGTRKTPENFLGEKKNLVNLDNLLGSNDLSTAGGNPFFTSSAPAANPFAAQQRKSPTLNEMRATQGQAPPNTSMAPRGAFSQINPFANLF